MLHITNGESVVAGFRQAAIEGEYLSWLDVLHDGPVPAGLELEELSAVRAEFVASVGWDSPDHVRAMFGKRDNSIRSFHKNDEVVLWFEHDLFDQLQLIQLLDFFAEQDVGGTRLSLICIDRFPGRAKFHGLGELAPKELASLLPSRSAVTDEQLELGKRTWTLFREPDPTGLMPLLDEDTSVLPFLNAALKRWIEEFPSTFNGLSRSERQFVDGAAQTPATKQEIYARSQAREEALFMGDASAFWRIERLASGPRPALARVDSDKFTTTPFARDLIGAHEDWIEASDADYWLGGVHVNNPVCWRWDPLRRKLSKTGHGAPI